MSVKVMASVWEFGPEDKSDLLLLLALADYANDDGECYPSVGKLATKARMDERTARRHLRNLEEAGYIETRFNRGRGNVNLYVVKKGTFCPPDILPPGQNTPEKGANLTVKGGAGAPLTLKNRKEPSGAHARKGSNSFSQRRDPSGYVYDKRLSYGENHALEQAFIAQKVAAE
jgi:DNA-binding transcriptional ArsR family regulator